MSGRSKDEPPLTTAFSVLPARSVTLVIPGRNASRTVAACLESVVPMLGHHGLSEIVFVDDGSSDATADIVHRYPVRYEPGRSAGPGSARNVGWRLARTEFVWFIDADCVAEADALTPLLDLFDRPNVAAVGGSYGNMCPDSIVASLIHEEIVLRHRRMPRDVDFLATFNVVYRKSVLEAVGGFNEHFLKAQDAELAYRVKAAGFTLRFTLASRVGHFHERELAGYLTTQAHQGTWRVWLYLRHPRTVSGDAYSGVLDHVQPPLAILLLASALPALLTSSLFLPALLGGLLLLAQVPSAVALLRHTSEARMLLFIPFGALRAVARGVGMLKGLLAVVVGRLRNPAPMTDSHGLK